MSSEAKILFEKKNKKRSLSYCKQAILILSLYTVWSTVCFSVRAKERRTQWPGPALTHASRNGAEQSPHRDVPGRSADDLGRAPLCLFPGAAQALSASLRQSGARTMPLGWCWGSKCGTWSPLSWLRGAWRASRVGVEGGPDLGPGRLF